MLVLYRSCDPSRAMVEKIGGFILIYSIFIIWPFIFFIYGGYLLFKFISFILSLGSCFLRQKVLGINKGLVLLLFVLIFIYIGFNIKGCILLYEKF